MPRLQTFGFAKATSESCIREMLRLGQLFPDISKSELIEIEDRGFEPAQVPGLPSPRTGSREDEKGRGHETDEAHCQAL